MLYDLHVIYQIIVQTFLYMILMLLTASVPSVGHIANALRTYSLVLRREVYLSRAGATSPVGPVLTGHFWPHPIPLVLEDPTQPDHSKSGGAGPALVLLHTVCLKSPAINFKASYNKINCI